MRLTIFYVVLQMILLTGCAMQTNNPDGGRLKMVGANIMISETEVTVAEWLRYINQRIQNEGRGVLPTLKPIKECLNPKLSQFMDIEISKFPVPRESLKHFKCKALPEDGHFYHKHACAWASIPITGITYEQAVEFCLWKTKYGTEKRWDYKLPDRGFW